MKYRTLEEYAQEIELTDKIIANTKSEKLKRDRAKYRARLISEASELARNRLRREEYLAGKGNKC